MLLPDPLRALLDEGVVQQVLRPLKSGKEAALFVVLADDRICAAKVYKEVARRNFRQRQDYVEGRQVRDTRLQRAMAQGKGFGKEKSEEAWQAAEAAALDRLGAAGVRVPRAHQRAEGVLLMDLVVDAQGEPAPQLAAIRYDAPGARQAHAHLMAEIARMLGAGLIHGDLSEYNILAAAAGLTIIDLPQAIDVMKNRNAERLLLRDVANVTRFFTRFAPELKRSQYGEEMWLLYQQGLLRPDSKLTGRVALARGTVDAQIVLREIAAAKAEAAKRAEVAQWREEKRQAKIRGEAMGTKKER